MTEKTETRGRKRVRGSLTVKEYKRIKYKTISISTPIVRELKNIRDTLRMRGEKATLDTVLLMLIGRYK